MAKTRGIYIISTNFKFPRLKGKTDILYIGKASNLRRRLLTFPKQKGRTAIKRFLILERNGFKLLFSIKKSNHPKELEKRYLVLYEKLHLELPPLNHSS